LSEPAVAYCYRHPHRETLIRCTRCERPICPDCMRPASVGFHCPDDVDRAVRSTRPVRTAVGAKLLSSPPYVTIALIVANVAIYVWTGTHSILGINDPHQAALFQHWQLEPAYVHDGDYYKLLTAAFLHVNLQHIGTNMLSLAIIGPPIEMLLGRWRFAVLYFLGALGGSAAIYAFSSDTYGTTVGASGAIFALFGAAIPLVRKLSLDPQWLIGIVAFNFVVTFSVPDISKLGHLGGFVTGLLAGVAIGGLPRVKQRIAPRVQVAGLAGVAVAILLVVALRTATW
jgi:membrane associated rhomboid family serine protease